MKRIPKKAAAGVLFALAGISAYVYFSPATRSTENAYVNADVVNVAPEVSGRIVKVYVKENQYVHKGDALFDIDPEPYAIALSRAEAELAQARQNARSDSAEVRLAQAQIEQSLSDLANARSIDERDKKLVAQHFLSQQSSDDARTRVQSLQASLSQAQAKLAKARAMPAKDEDRGDILKAEAAIEQAKLDLLHTRVAATKDGQIGNLGLTEGAVVGIAAPLFAIIENDTYYIDANFKETELPGIKPGQKVDVKIDMYPGQHFSGTVESLGGSTGTAFSLLPAQNATGNWVKIAQRVPVRIRLASTEAAMRIGATATVTVHLE